MRKLIFFFRLPESKVRLRVHDFKAIWRIFDGFDWEDSCADAVSKSKSEQEQSDVG